MRSSVMMTHHKLTMFIINKLTKIVRCVGGLCRPAMVSNGWVHVTMQWALEYVSRVWSEADLRWHRPGKPRESKFG
jgi:hypothetical protein